MDNLTLMFTVNGLVGALMPLPQIIKVFRTESTNDVSLITWIISLITSSIWTYFGFHMNLIPNIAAGFVMCTLDIVLICYVMWLRFTRSSLALK